MPSGLPSYTLPPSEPATAVGPPHGVADSAGPRGTFGGSAAPAVVTTVTEKVAEKVAATERPTDDARNRREQAWQAAIGDQDLESAFPGSYSIDTTMPISTNAVENSGSLTGHILSQGWDQGAEVRRYSKAKVNIALLLVLLFLIGISFLFLATTGTAISDLVHGAAKH